MWGGGLEQAVRTRLVTSVDHELAATRMLYISHWKTRGEASPA